MRYDYRNVPKNVVLWGCAFQLVDSKEGNNLKCTPVKGMVVGNRFHKLKLNCKLSKTSVHTYSRVYTDTEQECIELYNEKVNNTIAHLEKLVADLKLERIEVK